MAKLITTSTAEAVSEKDVAARYQIHVQTLRNWRCNGEGPAYIKLKRLVRYPVRDLETYFQNHRIDPEGGQ